MTKEYLGDSVYCERDEFSGIILTTENGFGPTNTIFLEREVIEALIRYIGNFKNHQKQTEQNYENK